MDPYPEGRDKGSDAPYGSPLPCFLLYVTAIGAALTGLLGIWHSAHTPTTRNHHHTRGWLEHAGGARERQDGEKLVIVISNSQGFGQEVRDDETYAAILQGLLERRWGRTRVLNWSVPGGTGPEFVILGAAAARLDPDALVLVAGAGNFDVSLTDPGGSRKQDKPWSSDANRLLALKEVRSFVPAGFLDRFLALPDRLDLALGRLTLWRHRYVVGGWLARTEAFRPFEPGFQVELGPGRKVPEVSLDLLDSYLDATRYVRADVVALMPVRSSWRNAIRSVHPGFTGRLEGAGRAWRDWSDLVPDTEFLTQTHVTHEGHARLARALFHTLAP